MWNKVYFSFAGLMGGISLVYEIKRGFKLPSLTASEPTQVYVPFTGIFVIPTIILFGMVFLIVHELMVFVLDRKHKKPNKFGKYLLKKAYQIPDFFDAVFVRLDRRMIFGRYIYNEKYQMNIAEQIVYFRAVKKGISVFKPSYDNKVFDLFNSYKKELQEHIDELRHTQIIEKMCGLEEK